MNRPALALLIALSSTASAQDAKPAFEAADVRVSPKVANPFPRAGLARGRYEIKQATMVDLIRFAYGFDGDKVLGGPNWLELDRFDVAGKVPQGSTPDDHKLMLRALLAARFKLAAHEDTKPLPAYALTAPKKHSMKTAEGSEETGCRTAQSNGAPPPPLPPPSPDGAGGGGVTRVAIVSAMASGPGGGGAPAQFTLGPGMTVSYNCRNMTMASFVSNLRTMFGTNLGTSPVIDETGLDGKFNFDLRYSINLIGPAMHEMGDRIPLPVAIEKQLGLKLEEKPVPTKVLVVDRVNRDPGANPPGTAEALPPLPQATEFEVATIKPVEAGGMMGGRFQMQPGGRLVSSGMPLMFLITRAFNTTTPDQIVGIPPFAQTDRYDLIAKVPGETAAAASGFTDMDALAPLVLKLLVDRFNLKYHMEDRPVSAYTLVAGKPKMKKADPNSRTSCKTANAPAGAPPGSRVLTCQNVTMAQFAERLQRMAPELSWPVADATGIEGTYDLAITFTIRPQMMMMGGGPMPPGMMAGAGVSGGGGGGGAVPTAADPIPGQTIFEAVEKQLGLKLEKRQRTGSVIVIDHMDQKPTEN